MTDTRERSTSPWLTAGVLGIIAIALAVALAVLILPNRGKLPGGLSTSEKRAVTAASLELRNVLTLSRKSFDADSARALSGASGKFRQDLPDILNRFRTSMTAGKFDLKGEVGEAAFEQHNGNSTLVLLTGAGYTVGVNGIPVLKTRDRFELTMTHVKGKWLASDFQNVGLV